MNGHDGSTAVVQASGAPLSNGNSMYWLELMLLAIVTDRLPCVPRLCVPGFADGMFLGVSPDSFRVTNINCFSAAENFVFLGRTIDVPGILTKSYKVTESICNSDDTGRSKGCFVIHVRDAASPTYYISHLSTILTKLSSSHSTAINTYSTHFNTMKVSRT